MSNWAICFAWGCVLLMVCAVASCSYLTDHDRIDQKNVCFKASGNWDSWNNVCRPEGPK